MSRSTIPTMTFGNRRCVIAPGPIHPHWQKIAGDKGFDIIARIRDRYHLGLRHHACGRDMIAKLYTLRTAAPLCPHCLNDRRRELCDGAGVTFIAPARPHYLRIRLPCGHEAERQQAFLERVKAGQTEIRCGSCLEARLKAEAEEHGWTLLGPDPNGVRSHRLYRHVCGHVQRVAMANMQTGRFTCHGCAGAWTTDPSHIYLMRFILRSGRIAVKVGFSRNPWSRLRHQLVTDRDQDAALIRVVAVPTGHQALRHEKRLHMTLRTLFPGAELDRAEFASEVRVLSELYCGSIEPEVNALLDDIELRIAALSKRRAKLRRKQARHDERHPRNRQRRKRPAGGPQAGRG